MTGAGHARLFVDREQIATFVNALFRYVDDGGFVSMRAFRDDIDGTYRSANWPVVQINGAGLDPVIESAAAFAQECADAAVPVVFAPPVASFIGAPGAAEKDIANGLVLSVECDERPALARQLLEDLLGPATIVAASGGEWVDPDTGESEPRLHIHWRLTEATRTFVDHVRLKEARRVAQILAGADGTAISLVHPMRWPGSWHRNPPYPLCASRPAWGGRGRIRAGREKLPGGCVATPGRGG